MNLHEYQAKQLFAEYGLPVSEGVAAETVPEAIAAADVIGGDRWVVKAQVHAGGRGKAGGVKLVNSLDEVRSEAERMLSMKISTYQTGGLALPVDKVLICEALDIASDVICVKCQSVMQPSWAAYWHMGAMMMRLGSSSEPSLMGSKSLAMCIYPERIIAIAAPAMAPTTTYGQRDGGSSCSGVSS